MTKKEAIAYIKDNLNSIDSNDFIPFYDKLEMDDRGDVTSLLLEAGINPLLYMNKVPDGYLSYQMMGITHVDIPINIKVIGEEAFRGCASLKKVIIPEGVKALSRSAFRECNSLAYISILKSVNIIENYVFMFDAKLKSLNYEGTKIQWTAISRTGGWNWYSNIRTIHCVDGDIQL